MLKEHDMSIVGIFSLLVVVTYMMTVSLSGWFVDKFGKDCK
jgi:hypothetical protein